MNKYFFQTNMSQFWNKKTVIPLVVVMKITVAEVRQGAKLRTTVRQANA